MRSFLGNAIMEKENKKKGQVMNIINKLSVVISVYNEEAVLDTPSVIVLDLSVTAAP